MFLVKSFSISRILSRVHTGGQNDFSRLCARFWMCREFVTNNLRGCCSWKWMNVWSEGTAAIGAEFRLRCWRRLCAERNWCVGSPCGSLIVVVRGRLGRGVLAYVGNGASCCMMDARNLPRHAVTIVMLVQQRHPWLLQRAWRVEGRASSAPGYRRGIWFTVLLRTGKWL